MDYYSVSRYLPSGNDNLKHLYNDNEMINTKSADLIQMINNKNNIRYLSDIIISKGNGNLDVSFVMEQVSKYLESWVNMGKFDDISISQKNINGTVTKNNMKFASPVYMLAYYNKEFIETFTKNIIPESITNVKSVTNPGGMYAQQERIITESSKPIPFYERALYKRLEDRVLDQKIDETQNLFYGMELTGKDTTIDHEHISPANERREFVYRMKPNY
jgi:hypothetical protein